MGDSRAATAIDRLPWLADEPTGKAASRRRSTSRLWSALVLIVLAAAGAWYASQTMLTNGSQSQPASSVAGAAGPSATTLTLPQARTVAIAPQAPAEPTVQAPPQESAPTAVHRPPMVRHGRAQARRAPIAAHTPKAAPAAAAQAPVAATPPPPIRLEYWPVRATDGVTGRMVRIGTFSSPRQAKKGWGKVVRIYPGIKRIPALVVPLQSLRNGRTYYRLQMGTTSQAHSEVLCQRMRIIGQSCVVVGLNRAAT